MRNACLLALPMLVLAAACSSSGQTEAASDSPRPRASRDLITAEELADVQETNVHDAIRRLRPRWLMVRSAGNEPVLFIENSRVGGLERLDTMSVDEIQEIRFINSRDATTRWGTGYPGGVIQVMLKRAGG